MTTPERLRRRQRREEILLILLGVAVGLVSIYFHQRDVDSRQCMAHNFSDLSSALSVRGDLAAKDSAANEAESAATRQLIIDAFAAKNRQEAFAAFHKAQEGWAKVDKQRAQIQKEREANPIPDFPAGTCD